MNTNNLIENWEKGICGAPVLCGQNVYGLPIKCTPDGVRCQFMLVSFDTTGEVALVTGKLMEVEEYVQTATSFSMEDKINEKLLDVAMFLRLAKGVWDWDKGFELNL